MLAFGVSILKTLRCVAVLAGLASLAVAQGPVEGNCPVFPADNIWNARVDQLPVNSSSSAWVSTIGPSSPLHPDFGSGTYNGEPIGIPYVTVPGSQTKYPATFTYQSESDPGPYAIPLNAPVEGGSSSTGDRHVIAVDTDNCILYEIYDGFPQAASWQGGSGAIFNLSSDALRPAGWTSADAAGLPIFPGLVRYEEIVSGAIRHAIRFTVPQTQNTYVWPGRHEASSLTGAQYPPMGARFRLKSSFDISTFSATNQIILTALQRYGMLLADNGSSWFISGAPDSRWDNDDLHALTTIHGSNFEAVDVSTLMVDPNSGATVPVAGGTPAANSVAPNSGSGASQTFSLQYSDSAGGTSLQSVWAYFNATLANPASNSCLLYYNSASNQINLLNDATTAWLSATLGAAATLQNSQCSLHVATATVAPSGNTLTLNLTVTFLPAFTGSKNIYLHAVDVSGDNSGWQQLGSWTVTSTAGTPSTVSVSPSSGSGASQTFALQYSDTAGASSLTQVWAYFNATLANPASSACMVDYNTANNQINLLNDNATAWLSANLGSATTLQNSQCSLNVATATVAASGNNLTLNVTITFKPGFAGAKNVYLHSVDVSGANSGWQQLGSWTVTSGAGTASTASVTPNSGSGTGQTFTFQYSDTAGAASLTQVWAYFSATLANPAASACMVDYNTANNQINLLSDNATAWMPATLGSATTLQNSQCSLNVATATVVLSGDSLTLNVTVTFKPAFAGGKNVYLHAVDVSGSNSGWQQLGGWTVSSGAGTPSTVSVTPNSGSGSSQTFAFQYSDTAGAANLQQVWAYFNATLANPASSACLLYYNSASNQINLLNNTATAWLSATLGAASTLQNSQCSLNVATATVSRIGDVLTLSVTVTFQPAFAGSKNIYLHAVDVSGANSGWQDLGTWVAAFTN
jgi:hypothetical protein